MEPLIDMKVRLSYLKNDYDKLNYKNTKLIIDREKLIEKLSDVNEEIDKMKNDKMDLFIKISLLEFDIINYKEEE